MKMNIKFVIKSIVLLLLITTLFLSGCSHYIDAHDLDYVLFENDEQTIGYKQTKGTPCYGYIYLNDIKYDTKIGYNFDHTIYVSLVLDGHYQEEYFECYDLNDKNELVSVSNDVVLFGQNFGKIILKEKELDKSLIDASEYYGTWKSDGLSIMIYSHAEEGGIRVSSMRFNKNDYYIRWIYDSHEFEIYDNNPVDNNGSIVLTPIVCGTYENTAFEEVTLNFESDVLELGVTTINLELK